MNLSRQNELFVGLSVAFIAFLVYATSLVNGFVSDDHSVILHNPVLGGNVLSLFSAIDSTNSLELLPYYRPVTYLTFQLELWLHGFKPLPMHFVNVVLHSINAFLVFRLGRSFFSDLTAPTLLSLLFAVHPLHSEAVNFLSGGRNTLLACLFLLVAYLVHHCSVNSNSLPLAFSGALCFLLGMFSKESALMVFPFIVWLEFPSLQDDKARLRSCLRLIPYGVALLCYLCLRWTILSRLGIQTGILPGVGTESLERMYHVPSLVDRLQNNLYIIPKYLMTIIWPLSLSPRYVVPGHIGNIVAPIIVAWTFILGSVGWLIIKRSSTVTLFGLSWIIAFWLPVSGVVYFSGVVMADRFLYIPAIGLWLVLIEQYRYWFLGTETVRRYGVVVMVILMLVLAMLTVLRNRDWKSDLSLYSRIVEQYPENPFGHYNLGSAYIERRGPGDLLLAEKEFNKVMALDPQNISVYTPLGFIGLSLGNFERALKYYTKALEYTPLDRDARINRGIVYEKLGRERDALADYQFYLGIPGTNNLPGSREYAEERIRELLR